MVRVSSRLRLAALQARSEGIRAYQLAHRAGMSPSAFSAILSDITPLDEGDERVVRIARVLGVPDADAFEPITDKRGRQL